MSLRGFLLFLFIPLVLFLYLRQPFGPGLSVLTGVVIMFGHRFLAAPWMERHATDRCLWCGRRVGGPQEPGAPPLTFAVRSAGADRLMVACSPRHRELAARFLTFIGRHRYGIGVGIFVPLVLLLVGTLARAAGHPFISPEGNARQFKTIVALTVVLVSLTYRTVSRPREPLRSPFPLHNLFLLGIRNTLWVFRVVGAWWLAAAVATWLR